MRAAEPLPSEGNVAATADARILAVASAVPPFELDQSDVMRRIELALGPRSREIVRLLPMFGNTGIERRYSCVPIEWYERLHEWPERNQVYLDSAIDLLEKRRAACSNGRNAVRKKSMRSSSFQRPVSPRRVSTRS